MIMLMMNSTDFTGGNSELDGIENLCRRGDEVIDYIFT